MAWASPSSAAAAQAGSGAAAQALSRLSPATNSMREEGHSVLLAHVKDLHDARVLHAGHRRRLTPEAIAQLRPAADPGLDDLQRHHPELSRQSVLGLVDDAHAAVPQFAQHFISDQVRPGRAHPPVRPAHQHGQRFRRG